MTRTKVKVNSSFWVRPLRSVDSAGYLLDYSHSLLCLWCLDAVIVRVGVGTCVFRSTDLVKVKWYVVAAKRPAVGYSKEFKLILFLHAKRPNEIVNSNGNSME